MVEKNLNDRFIAIYNNQSSDKFNNGGGLFSSVLLSEKVGQMCQCTFQTNTNFNKRV